MGSLSESNEHAETSRNNLKQVHCFIVLTLGFTTSPRLAPAQAILKEEERKAAAREALVEAINQRDVPTLLGGIGWHNRILG